MRSEGLYLKLQLYEIENCSDSSCRLRINNYWMRFFFISRIIKVGVEVISRSRSQRLRLTTFISQKLNLIIVLLYN